MLRAIACEVRWRFLKLFAATRLRNQDPLRQAVYPKKAQLYLNGRDAAARWPAAIFSRYLRIQSSSKPRDESRMHPVYTCLNLVRMKNPNHRRLQDHENSWKSNPRSNAGYDRIRRG